MELMHCHSLGVTTVQTTV